MYMNNEDLSKKIDSYNNERAPQQKSRENSGSFEQKIKDALAENEKIGSQTYEGATEEDMRELKRIESSTANRIYELNINYQKPLSDLLNDIKKDQTHDEIFENFSKNSLKSDHNTAA